MSVHEVIKYLCDKCESKFTAYQCLNDYLNIFEYFPLNMDICIQNVVILKAEYYSNIQIFCPNNSE